MLLLSDRTRKASAILSAVWMLTLTLLPTVEAIAADAAFTAGQAAGQAGVASITGVLGSPTKIQGLGINGLGTQAGPSDLTSLYKGGGRNDINSITAINNAGTAVKNQSMTSCPPNDQACLARQTLAKNNGVANPYIANAKAIRASVSQLDPLSVLGIGLPATNNGSVCVNSTTTIPGTTEPAQCISATFKTFVNYAKLPVTATYNYSTPTCIAGYNLSGNWDSCDAFDYYSCPTGQTLNGAQCGETINQPGGIFQCQVWYPATENYKHATPGCLGGYNFVADPNNSAKKTCQQTVYSCPAGMRMNGMLCEDPARDAKLSSPDCVLLGYDPGVKTEVFYCGTYKLNECTDLDAKGCTDTGTSKCVQIDEVVGSPTKGQCLATEKNYACPVAPKSINTTACGYEPMCYNGNCFTPPGNQCSGISKVTTKTDTKQCALMTSHEFRQCSLVETKNSQGAVIGYTAGTDCSTINNQGGGAATCTKIEPTFDPTAGHYPTKLTYSCIGGQTDECTATTGPANDGGCKLSSSQCLEYECLDPLPTQLGSQQQAGTTTTSIVGSVSNGAAPVPTADMNTCSLKGACLMKQSTYACTSTVTTPDNQCYNDFGQMMVSMEASKQAGAYMDQNTLKIFSGEFSRCDRRAVGVFGANLGSKSCCNIDSPDPKNNAQLFGSPLMQGVSLLGSGVSAGSSYMYDYMMSSQKFVTAAQEMWAAGALTDNMAQQGLNIAQSSAESLANFNFSPSVSLVPGLSVGYGAVGAAGTTTTGSALLGAGTSTTVVNAAGTAATTTTTVAGVSTTSTATMIPGTNFNLSYNPTMLYITAAMMAYQAYQAALACDEEDYKSSTKGKAKLCYDTGTWCESKDCGLFGCTCTKFRTGKCCYNSKLARIINQQGRTQLGLDIRTCDGFTVAQIQQLDWSKIDLSEFIADMLAQAQQSAGAVMNATTQSSLQNKLTTSTKANGATKMQPKLPISQ